MELNFQHLDSGILVIALAGRMDVTGAMAIDVQFTNVVSAHKAVIVDMSGVEFLASMGLRTLIMGAKSIMSKKGRMILLQPNENVEMVLVSSGTDTLIPITHDRADAERRVAI